MVRIISETRPIRACDVDGYVANLGGHRVAFVGGVVVRDTDDSVVFVALIPVAFAGDAAFLTVPVPITDTTDSDGLGSDAMLRIRTARTMADRPADGCVVAIEMTIPDAWEQAFERRDPNTIRTDFDSNDTRSVVITVPGERTLMVARCDVSVVIDRDRRVRAVVGRPRRLRTGDA